MTTTIAFSTEAVEKPLTYYAAIFSPNRAFRYTLSREVNPNGVGTCAWIMLNPSIADEYILDPTLTRCFNYTLAWGYRYMLIGNIFAYRATDPLDMKAQVNPDGIFNEHFLRLIGEQSDLIICGWGTNQHPRFPNHGDNMAAMLHQDGHELYALKITKEGFPSHPLYLRKDLEPILYLGA